MKTVGKIVLTTCLVMTVTLGCGPSRYSMPNPTYTGMGSVVDTGFAEITPMRKPPRPHMQVEALYPESLEAANIKSIVFVKVLVANNGKVERAEVVKSDDDRFNKYALEAARRWDFSGHKHKIEVWKVLRFDFGPHHWVE